MNTKQLMKRPLVITLCVAMITAFSIMPLVSQSSQAYGATNPGKVINANWTNFRGNSENNAVVDSKIPTSASEAMLYWAVKNGTGWSAAPGSPILVDGYLYFNAGEKLIKMDSVSGEIAATGNMVTKSAFSICPPTYADGKIFIALSDGKIQAFNAKTLKSLWVYTDKLGGQPNTPITYYGGYIYAGFWGSETKNANFVCLSAADVNTSKTTEAKSAKWTYTSAGGFYWAGAYACKNFVLVGTDDGQSGYDSQTAKLIAFNPKTGKILDEMTGFNGDIRSSISYDEKTDSYYFTSKGGTFYSVKVSANGKISSLKSLELGGMSTSTPAVYNGRAYVGVAGTSQFGAYSGHNITVIDLTSWKVAYKAPTMGYPQTSGLVCTAYEKTEGCVYVYFFDNYTPGKLRYIKDKPGQTTLSGGTSESYTSDGDQTTMLTADTLFTPKKNQAQYAICSPITDEYGTIYFKNDSCYMMALGSKIKSISVEKAPSQTTYDIGDKPNLSGIKVNANLANGMTRDITDYVTCTTDPVTEDQTDFNVYYSYSMYNDEGEADPLFTSVDIKVNDAQISAANNKAKSAIKASKPVGTKVSAGTRRAKVSWSSVKGAEGYQIARATSKKGTFKVIKSTSALKYTNTGLKAKKTYYYKVRGYRVINNVKYYSKWSAVKSVKI